MLTQGNTENPAFCGSVSRAFEAAIKDSTSRCQCVSTEGVPVIQTLLLEVGLLQSASSKGNMAVSLYPHPPHPRARESLVVYIFAETEQQHVQACVWKLSLKCWVLVGKAANNLGGSWWRECYVTSATACCET